MSSLLHNSLSTLSGDSTSQSNMMNPIQPGSNLDSGQGNALSSLQQTPVGSVQQNLVSISQPTNVNTLLTQSGARMLQPNIPLKSNSNMIQHQHLKQQQQQHEQQMLQTQQLKRLQQRQNLMQNQQMQQQQQLHQQAPSPMPGDSDKPVSGISSLKYWKYCTPTICCTSTGSIPCNWHSWDICITFACRVYQSLWCSWRCFDNCFWQVKCYRATT